jgi:hypothetical protein
VPTGHTVQEPAPGIDHELAAQGVQLCGRPKVPAGQGGSCGATVALRNA